MHENNAFTELAKCIKETYLLLRDGNVTKANDDEICYDGNWYG